MWRLSVVLAFVASASGQQLRLSPASDQGSIGKHFAPGSMIVAIPEEPIDPPDSIRLELSPRDSGSVFPLRLLGVFSGCAWAVLPEDAPLGPATVTLTTPGGRERSDIVIQPSAVGIFANDWPRVGARAQVIKADAGPVTISLMRPARPGEIVTLWLTGLGNASGKDVSVELAGNRITPLFAGRAPGQPGVDQINVLLPAEPAFGCYVPLQVRVGSVVSDAATISTAASAGPCAHPLRLSADQLRILDEGGPVLVGSFVISTAAADPTFEPSGRASTSLSFSWQDGGMLLSPALSEGSTSCSWLRLGGAGIAISVLNASRDAGRSIVLNGPTAESISVPAIREGYYEKVFDTLASSPFAPGVWTLAVPGGAGIAAFEASLSIPKPIRLLHPDALRSFSRNADLQIDWAPESFSSGDAVSVFLQTWPFDSPPFGAESLGILCAAPARDGRLVVPRDMLALLPPDPAGDRGTIQVTTMPNGDRPNVAAAPLVSGGTAPVVMGYHSNQWMHVEVK